MHSCFVPTSILDCVGELAFIPTFVFATRGDTKTNAPTNSKIRRAILSLLRQRPTLLLVLYSDSGNLEKPDSARKNMPENMRCRVIGNIARSSENSVAESCRAWREKFAPNLAFSILDQTKLAQIDLIDLDTRSHRIRLEIPNIITKIFEFPSQTSTDHLRDDRETVAVAFEAYGHGLSSFAYALIHPILKSRGLLPNPSTRDFAYDLVHGGTQADSFGELCRIFKMQFKVSVIPQEFPLTN